MTVAWITGGGTGIGRALAARLNADGAQVVITGRRKEVLEKAAGQIRASEGSGQIEAIAGDASDPAHVADIVTRTTAQWGPINLLINNAGANIDFGKSAASFEDYRKSFEVNCLTAIRATDAVLPAMRAAHQGTIVNISSIYGRWASSRSTSYSVGKYALAGYTDALRQSLSGTGVHVLGVYPGFIKTDMTLPFVEPGSLKSRLGKSPDQMAGAILRALRRKEAELYYPWYVSWALRLHRWMPEWSDRLANHVKK